MPPGFNPTNVSTGRKVLRKLRLGPSFMAWYPKGVYAHKFPFNRTYNIFKRF